MRIFKSISIVLLVLALSLFFAGCNKQEVVEESEPEGFVWNENFTYSSGLSDNGYFPNLKASAAVELPKYSGLEVPKEYHQVEEYDIEAELEGILWDHMITVEIKDRAIVDGDTVNIDYIGRIKGVAFDGGSTRGEGTEVIIGVTQYIDDFLEQLIGHHPGDKFDVEVTFPENYHAADLAGKDAVFETTINYIVETQAPELTDKFVKEELSSLGLNSVADLREHVRNNIQRMMVYTYVQDFLLEESKIKEIPAEILNYAKNMMLREYSDYAKQYGMDLNSFMQNSGYDDVDSFLAEYEEYYMQNARLMLITQAIAEAEKITISDEDLTAYFLENFSQSDFSGIEAALGRPYIKMVVMHDRVLKTIINQVVLAE